MDESAVAALIGDAQADLARRLGVDPDAVRVLVVESVTWPDGSLGCPEPGRFYTQALVPGHRILLETGGETYAYHASRRGAFKLCADPPSERRGGIGNAAS